MRTPSRLVGVTRTLIWWPMILPAVWEPRAQSGSCGSREIPALSPHLKVEHREDLFRAAAVVPVEAADLRRHTALVKHADGANALGGQVLVDHRPPRPAHPRV